MPLFAHKQPNSNLSTCAAYPHRFAADAGIGVGVLFRKEMAPFAMRFLGLSASLLLGTILHILFLCPRCKVRGVAAWRIVAAMTDNAFLIQTNSEPQEGGYTMRPIPLICDAHHPISIGIASADPIPAPGWLIDFHGSHQIFHGAILA